MRGRSSAGKIFQTAQHRESISRCAPVLSTRSCSISVSELQCWIRSRTSLLESFQGFVHLR